MTTTDAFTAFDERLYLATGARERAQAAHNKLRDVLADAGVAIGAILQGSFARKTMLRPLNDIDIVVFLAAEHDHLQTEAGGSEKAMDLIEEAVRDAYASATFERSRHALKVDLGDEFTFDVVPGFDTEAGNDIIWIADRDQDRFEPSDTRRVTNRVQQRNQGCDGAFIHQVRMIKHWMRHVVEDAIPGFVGECITYAAVMTEMPHDEACATTFTVGSKLLAGGSVEVPGNSENVLERLTPSQVDLLANELEIARARADEAIGLAAAGDDATAVDVWHAIFGEPFPEAPKQTVEEALSALMGGGVSSTLRATPAANRHRAPVTRSWGAC